MEKPHIKLIPWEGYYSCCASGVVGYGVTPRSALYAFNLKVEMLKRRGDFLDGKSDYLGGGRFYVNLENKYSSAFAVSEGVKKS